MRDRATHVAPKLLTMITMTMMTVTTMLTLFSGSAQALDAGKDVFVPAAARVGTWYTDLYLLNPGEQPANLTIYWLERGRPNPDPAGVSYLLAAGESLVLGDTISTVFGLSEATGALRIRSDQNVVVSSRIYNRQGDVTFGQGFEGIPRSLAISAGGTTDIVGLTSNTAFRSNIILLDVSGAGSSVVLSLRDSTGDELAAASYTLQAFEPVLDPVTALGAVTGVADAVLHAEVTSGAAIIVASKVDNDPETGDPTTLEPWRSSGNASDDGTYQLSIYDRGGYATGGYLRIANGVVTELDATYSNWDKGDSDPACTHTFRLGSPEAGQQPLTAYASGISFSRSYDAGAEITWTITLTVEQGQTLTGTVDAYGRAFPITLDGCNGVFPRLQLIGGKTSP